MPAAARLDIAITDRNSHVREFLCRELAEEGHRAGALANAAQLLEALSGSRPPQVLVLDPGAIGTRLAEVANRLKGQAGRVMVVLHVFEGEEPQPGFDGALVVEKDPHVAALKAAVNALAAQLAAQRPEAAGPQDPQERP
jgi:DNA-binding response OmpR family regulator